jgi:hypothetical protein
MKTFSITIIFCFTFALLMGCSNRSFDREELYGGWAGKSSGNKTNLLPILLALKKDGTFDISNLPRSVFYFNTLDSSVIGLSRGKWKISKSTEDQQVVDLVFEHADGVEGRLPFSVRLFVTTSRAKPILIYYHGDPDTDSRLDFEKLTLKE